MHRRTLSLLAATAFAATLSAQQPLLTGQSAFTDWNQQSPGVRHKITLSDLPEPKPDEAIDNGPHLVPRPEKAWPIAPPGFKVTLYAGGDSTPMQRSENKKEVHPATQGTFVMPRLMRTAPNGDIFLADSQAGAIFVLRGVGPDGKAATIEKFATGLDHPFGIAFYPAQNPRYVYIGNATTIQRFAYKTGDLHASAAPETIVPDIPGYAQLRGGGHWTRDVVFNREGKMLVSVGSGSNADNADTHAKEFHRADVLEYTPEGKFLKVYAYGIRNCVGEAINPITGELWCSVNERDNLGNHLVPDYVTSIKEGGFYGWPWYYMGGHRDPRIPEPCADGTGPNPQRSTPLTPEQAVNCKTVNMASKVLTPDVLVQPHMASLEMVFYPLLHKRDADEAGSDFPLQFGSGGAFAAEHGSWNRKNRAGYEVIYIPMQNGHATGEYDDFLTGFVTPDGEVWGRPVGVTVGNDGSLFVTDDGSRSVWHVTYTGNN